MNDVIEVLDNNRYITRLIPYKPCYHGHIAVRLRVNGPPVINGVPDPYAIEIDEYDLRVGEFDIELDTTEDQDA